MCNGIGIGKWSPDGSKIVYSVADNPIRPDGNATDEGLWIMHADGSHPVQFTKPPLPTSIADNSPAWSPDGKQIIFVRNRQTNDSYDDQALFLINLDGTGLKQVTSWGELKAGLEHWSPDGKLILFQSFGSFPDATTPQIYTIFPDGTHLVQLTTNERNTWPAWSPGGTKIIFAHRSTTGQDQNAHLYEMNADGSGLVQITKNPFWQLQPAWVSAASSGGGRSSAWWTRSFHAGASGLYPRLGMATTAYFVSIAPLLAAQAPNLINAGYETSLAVFGLGATMLGIIGPLLLGMAVIRAKVFPALVGLLLMVSAVLSLVNTFSGGALFALIGLVGIVSSAMAYGWVGMSLTQQHTGAGAEARSSVQTALR